MQENDILHIRDFNRFYTNILQLTDKYHLHTQFTILEARILLEIDHGLNTANQLLTLLKLDKGYVSRVLKKLELDDLITKSASPKDMRVKVLSLTPTGKKALDNINERADQQINQIFANVTEEEIQDIINSMQKIQSKLTDNSAEITDQL